MPSKKPSAKPIDLKQYLPPAALVISVVLFGLTQHILFALAALAALAFLLYTEFRATQNWKELAGSLAIALGAWVALSLLLNTTSPINIITSCSMLPEYERGDLILLQSASLDAPRITIEQSLANATYQPAEINSGGQLLARIYQPTLDDQPLFRPRFATCPRKPLDSSQKPVPQVCLESIDIQNRTIAIRQSPDVVVYDSQTQAGLIIHRTFAILDAPDGSYLLTKGDNNNFLDQQSGFKLIPYQTAGRVLINLPFLGALVWKDNDNRQNGNNPAGNGNGPASAGLQLLQENQIPVKGKVLLRIPYIGYIKLLLFLQIQAPAGCDSVLQKPA